MSAKEKKKKKQKKAKPKSHLTFQDILREIDKSASNINKRTVLDVLVIIQRILQIPDHYVDFGYPRKEEQTINKWRPTVPTQKSNARATLIPSTASPTIRKPGGRLHDHRKDHYAVYVPENTCKGLPRKSWFLVRYPQNFTAGDFQEMCRIHVGGKLPDKYFKKVKELLTEWIERQERTS